VFIKDVTVPLQEAELVGTSSSNIPSLPRVNELLEDKRFPTIYPSDFFFAIFVEIIFSAL
jgi:hypothetical protein